MNPPVQAWAALRGVRDRRRPRPSTSSSRIFDKLLVNFTWWVNREDAEGNNLFEGGFLGLDNIGPIDRSHLPVGGTLEQSDATGWMAFYAIAMACLAIILNRSGQRPGLDLDSSSSSSTSPTSARPWKARAVGRGRRALLRPAARAGRRIHLGQGPVDGGHDPGSGRGGARGERLERPLTVGKPSRTSWTVMASATRTSASEVGTGARSRPATGGMLLSRGRRRPASRSCSPGCSTRTSSSPRTGCARCPPTIATIPTSSTSTGSRRSIDYEPAESTTAMFGGNSNWRGPLWMPLNYLVIELPAALPPVLRCRSSRSSTRPDRAAARPWTRWRMTWPDRLDLDLPARPRRAQAPASGESEAAEPPGLARQSDLQRVLPRRQRRRDRRLPPDRLDRPDRRPDPPPARGG